MEKVILTKDYYGEVSSSINDYIESLVEEREGFENQKEQDASEVANHRKNLLSHRLNIRNLKEYVRGAEKEVSDKARRVESKRLELQRANLFKNQIVKLIGKLDRMYKSQVVGGKPQQIKASDFILDEESKESKSQLEPLTQELYQSLSEGLEAQNVQAREDSKVIEAEYNARLAKLQAAKRYLEAHRDALKEAISKRNAEREKYRASKSELRETKRDLKDVNGDLKQVSRDASLLVKSYVKRRPVMTEKYQKYLK